MKKWTNEEIKFLTKNYTTIGHKKCKEKLNRTDSSIYWMASELGISINEAIRKRAIGKKFNKLTIDSFEEMTKYGPKYKCICECGNETVVLYKSLTSKNTQSCGCWNKEVKSKRRGENHPQWSGLGEISGNYWSEIRGNCIRPYKTIEFDITKEYIWNLFLKQNRKCALTGIELTFERSLSNRERIKQTASLDRIDSDKGYIEGNVQWVHKKINWLKNKFSEKEFLFWVEKIFNHKIKNLNASCYQLGFENDYCI